MDIILAFTLFSLIILIYWVIAEFFTVLFRFTGVPDEKARFQVISLLTGCGFTTRESEMILSSRSRRRLSRMIMLFGYVFNITFITALINVFLSLKSSDRSFHQMIGVLFPVAAVAVIFLFIRIPRIHTWGEYVLEQLYGSDAAAKIEEYEAAFKAEHKNSVMCADLRGNCRACVTDAARILEEMVD